jgi:hypothetical protein
MSFAVEPTFAPYPLTLVAETELDVRQRRAHEEANRQRHHAPADTPAPEEDSTEVPADPESSPFIGTLLNVRA